MSPKFCTPRRDGRWALGTCVAVGCWASALIGAGSASAQNAVLVEDYEFAASDLDARDGVMDLTDFANRPALYINGECDLGEVTPCPAVAEGLFSIGTDAVFCLQSCEAGTRIGFRRYVSPVRFPQTCGAGNNYLPLQHTYGDPNHPGPVPPDFPLSELRMICDAYGDGAFADGPTGTHFWVNLVDCDGEIYEYFNASETSLYSELWTFDVEMGRDLLRLSPQSLVDVPDGDRLLTGIVATECLIQDDDSPPTTFGKWYIDNLRIIEPAGSTAIPTVSQWGLIVMTLFLLTVGTLLFHRAEVMRASVRS